MPARHDSILGTGYWDDESKLDANLSTYARLTKWAVDLLQPSFLTKAGWPRKQLGRTAYLDGLRGFAAFIVYWHHHQLWAHDAIGAGPILENAFGYNGHYYFACLPAVRTFFTGGHFAVSVFFVISGYVLSAKPLMLIHAGEHIKLADNLASALFRRWLRLFIPVICTTFLYMTSWHAFGLWTDSEHQSNYRDELWKWYAEFKNFSFVFNTSGDPWFPYNIHVWSIPVEFRGSIVIYTALLALSRCTRNARLWCEVGLIFYFMYIVDGWFSSMFVAGMLLCDLDLLAENNKLPRFFSRLEPFKELIFCHLLVISIYLSGVPSHGSDLQVLKTSRGWYYLSFLKPQAVFDYKWFYLFWAATFLVASTSRIAWLKSFFETPFNQYMGRISFAFYLVHGPVLWILGDRLYVATGWVKESHPNGLPDWINTFQLPKAGPLCLELSFLAPNLILLPVTLWLAEITTKLLDKPSVKFAQWAYARTLAPSVKS
jgi:peptidoglycan/LPS O-acetylase OafA/YrhL